MGLILSTQRHQCHVPKGEEVLDLADMTRPGQKMDVVPQRQRGNKDNSSAELVLGRAPLKLHPMLAEHADCLGFLQKRLLTEVPLL